MFTVALSLLLLATETAAATSAQPAEAQQSVEASKAEKKICKREQATESRMGSKRICLTAAEWKERQSQSGDSLGIYK
jgi:hypothetical protein